MKEIMFNQFDEVFKKGLNVFVFGAPRCKDCRFIEPMLLELSKEFSDIGFYGIDVDKNDGVMDKMGIRRIPTILFVKDGVEMHERVVEPQNIKLIKEGIEKLV